MPKNVEIPGYGVVAFPDSMSMEQIGVEAAKLHSGSQPQPQKPMSGARAAGMSAEMMHPQYMAMARFLARALPGIGSSGGSEAGALGGMGLGAMTGPAAPIAVPALGYLGYVGGGAAGGAAGKVASNAASMGPAGEFLGMEPPTGLGAGVKREAAIGGIGGAAGPIVANVAGRVGGVLTGKTLSRASAVAENVARKAARTFKVPLAGVTDALAPLKQEAADMGLTFVKAVDKMEKSFAGTKSTTMDAFELHRVRKVADNIAKRIKDARDAQQPVGPALALKGRFWELLGDRARALLKQGVPEYEAAMKESQKAIGSIRRVPLVQQGPIKPSVGNLMGATEVLGRAVAGPQALQGYGNVLENPLFQLLLRNAGRPIAPALVPPDTLENR